MRYKDNLINIDSKDLTDLLNNGTKKLVYIGRPNCPGCVEMEPILKNKLKKYEMSSYYYNTKIAREEEFEEFAKIKNDLNAHYVPLLIHYDGDKELSRIYYDMNIDSECKVEEFIKEFIENQKVAEVL